MRSYDPSSNAGTAGGSSTIRINNFSPTSPLCPHKNQIEEKRWDGRLTVFPAAGGLYVVFEEKTERISALMEKDLSRKAGTGPQEQKKEAIPG